MNVYCFILSSACCIIQLCITLGVHLNLGSRQGHVVEHPEYTVTMHMSVAKTPEAIGRTFPEGEAVCSQSPAGNEETDAASSCSGQPAVDTAALTKATSFSVFTQAHG